MKVKITLDSASWEADLSKGVDVSIPIQGGGRGVRCWWVDYPSVKPFQQGDFIGSVKAGAPVNFNDIAFNPHAHGTHTECMGHITAEEESILSHPPPPWMLAQLVSVTPEVKQEDRIVTRSGLRQVLAETLPEAVILRTLPNPESKQNKEYSGSNPPYLEADAASWLCQKGVLHLLLDLPSVDREEDGGLLAAHKAFWDIPKAPRPGATITELIYVPDEVPDGMYLLNLQMAAFENDASPSRPILFPLKPKME
ncbi:cyclase family protein [Robiginitalea aurantiaca]|uniref:Cyclase family protein n=1 Tax=Robiginitalea aurantiaca TaxID=3056915 RepID=A0ABT7WBQ9_9FLAO|nr:cyclase family protein [Robiginitalea aurantiaca]MDM9630350.1 cyclase family protein [Robiginitalea aurantiaca]